ncbi:MAG: hypothetical protein ACT4P6_21275 [Gemmatimonadaceae bacterium]
MSLLGALLVLVSGGSITRPWQAAWCWGAMAVGMMFFSGVALINGWVMHFLTARDAATSDALLYDAFNRLLIGYGWLGKPLFLAGLTGLAILEVKRRSVAMPRAIAWAGLVVTVLSWGRGIGSATGMYFLEPLIFANVPAFLWLGYYGLRVATAARAAGA